MAERSKGFVQLEWQCPNCDNYNPGPEETCLSCGSPQPNNVAFVAPSERKFVSDEKKLERAKAGADIYCAFCETRNPATAEICIQCGADLAEGAQRQAGGQVKQRAAATTISCPSCEAENLSTNANCQACGASLQKERVRVTQPNAEKDAAKNEQKKKVTRNWLLGAALFLFLCCVSIWFFFLSPSEEARGTVSDVRWETSLPIQEEQEVRHTDEIGSPPAEAYDISCQTESEEVCHEETVDQGNGFAEVMENCETRSQEYCSYTVMEWQVVETLTLSGNDYDPQYPNPSLSNSQRAGTESVDYTVTFSTNQDNLTYSPESLSEFQQYQLGSEWNLTLNRLGGIVSVER